LQYVKEEETDKNIKKSQMLSLEDSKYQFLRNFPGKIQPNSESHRDINRSIILIRKESSLTQEPLC